MFGNTLPIDHLQKMCLSIFQESTFNVLKNPYIHREMRDIKCPPVAIINIRYVPFTPIERALSVPSYAVHNSKIIILKLCRS